jgi:hypothetical protein
VNLDDHNGQAKGQARSKLPAGRQLLFVAARTRASPAIFCRLRTRRKGFSWRRLGIFDLDRRRELTDLVQESTVTRHINEKRAGSLRPFPLFRA